MLGDWRSWVDQVPWRVVKETRGQTGDCVYHLEAALDRSWWRFGTIDMDCAGQGYGDSVAESIVERHNATLTLPL